MTTEMCVIEAGCMEKFSSYLAEWRIGHILTGEYLCDMIHDMTLNATKAVVESAREIKNGNPEAYGQLIYGLLLSGLAMQLLGYSRCAYVSGLQGFKIHHQSSDSLPESKHNCYYKKSLPRFSRQGLFTIMSECFHYQ